MSAAQPARKRGARAEIPITAEAIVEAAFRLIDERGHDGFSMRSLATELGVFPATLYWHVGDRSQLLGLVEQRWISEVTAPDHLDDWHEWMLELARRYRAAAHRHPNVARLVSVERARNTESLVIPDAIVGRLDELGLGADMVHAYNALMGAVQGFVVLELALIADSGPEIVSEVERDLRALDPQQFPNITRNFDQIGNRALSIRWTDAQHQPLDQSFEFLVQLLLDGLAAQLAKLAET
ncbi:MAG: TetR/AcrR family transcriptional regulator [Ilumatobacteraceae bacterium]|nr:TetR/AcrR family transcriptional regulator [Ilumatobacteraceae bacterium]